MARRVELAAGVLAAVLGFVALLYAVFLLPLGGYVSCTGGPIRSAPITPQPACGSVGPMCARSSR